MSTRDQRKAIAAETLRALESATYTADGTIVELNLQRSIAGTTSTSAKAEQGSKRSGQTLPRPTRIDVADDDTLAAAERLSRAGMSVVALNFASAKHAGGGWLSGAEAQEESVTRRSTLYASLSLAPRSKEFYDDMREAMRGQNDGLYSNAMIHTPDVEIIRGLPPEQPLRADPVPINVITAAAVNAGQARKMGVDECTIHATMHERARRVLTLLLSVICVRTAQGCR